MSNIENKTKNARGLKLLLRSLRNRNYRLFFIGQGTSLIGTWMQSAAMSWLVYRITGSAIFLGIVAFASQVPTFVIAPFAGAIADRWNRHRMLLTVQILAMLQALILAVLVIAGIINKWEIIALSVFSGIISGFDMPIRQAFVPSLVDSEDLPNAIALNSMIFNGARMIGPTIAGLIIAIAGEGICFSINAASFHCRYNRPLNDEASPASFFQEPKTRSRRHQGRPGLLLRFPPDQNDNLNACLHRSCRNALCRPSADLRKGHPRRQFANLWLSSGCCRNRRFMRSDISRFEKIRKRSRQDNGNRHCYFRRGIVAFSLSNLFWVSMFMLLLTGFGLMVQMACINTILQTIVDDDKRGRVMSLYTMAFMGMAPLGSLFITGIAHSFSAPRALQISGILCILAAMFLAQNFPFFASGSIRCTSAKVLSRRSQPALVPLCR